jgi:hypothetical protein
MNTNTMPANLYVLVTRISLLGQRSYLYYWHEYKNEVSEDICTLDVNSIRVISTNYFRKLSASIRITIAKPARFKSLPTASKTFRAL